uniref:Transposase IS200 like n=1 Tax=Candidatus Kentrum sp. SD TaxID=2126332 RepID=A0A450YMS7_9GAMM|nr:MAG: Transposase IS200 like [Candidatus Kentron sp. SD]VFK42835.1 MAG: Transposase IS200 like [Candidatus Kentron sp. SD]
MPVRRYREWANAGEIVAEEWRRTATVRDNLQLDQWVVMPNHFHGILTITGPIVGAIHESPPQKPEPRAVRAIHVRAIHESPLQPQSPRHMTVAQRRNMTLSKLIGRFKMLSSKRINQSRNTPGARLWQRNYWEHIVRDEPELQRLREYIQNNPIRWGEMDTLYSPARRHG